MSFEKLGSFLLLVIIPSLLSAQKTEWSEWELKGKVRVLEKTIFIPNESGFIDSAQFDRDTYYFNEFGFYDSIVRKDSKGIMMGKSVFDCDENGLPNGSVVQTRFANQILSYSEDYSYSANLDSLYIYTLDDFNKPSFYKLYCYDDLNRIIEFTSNTQAYIEREHFLFNEGGELIRAALSAGESDSIIQEYIYSMKNTRIRKVSYSPQNRTDSFEEEFDDYGNIVSRISINDSDSQKNETWKYQYDDQLNYLTKKYFNSGVLGLYVRRKIDYY